MDVNNAASSNGDHTVREPSAMPFGIAHIGGVPLAAASLADMADLMVQDCVAARERRLPAPRTVFDANGQALSLRETDPEYRKALEQADIVHADGGFLVFLSRLRQGPSIPERSATTDFFWTAAERAVHHGLSFFLLGGEPGLTERTRRVLREQTPKLNIAGCHHGFFDAENETDIVRRINESGADVVWVGLGKPLEQHFCNRNKHKLKAGWLVTCGGCFNFITGDYKRAPLWMQHGGLEWLHRLYCRPRILFWRYLITNPHALYLGLTR